MPLVNRLLDAFFRTLDAVDVARERIDRALGRSPRPEPWTTEWQPSPEQPAVAPAREARPATPPAPAPAPAPRAEAPKKAPAKAPAKAAKTGSRTTAKKVEKAPARADQPKPRASSGSSKASSRPGSSSRKGSVDRSGKDFDSPRAKAILEKLNSDGSGVISEDAALNGKRVLARVLWALNAADKAGSELGLTAADASALLHLAANMEVFATNVARTCRDETDLIEESAPDGRSKRYKLTAAGKAAAAKLSTRPL